MKTDYRKKRELIIFDLYQKDIFDAIELPFKSVIEDEEILKLIENVKQKLSEIDEIIEANLTNYSLKRLSFVDRAIIRYATYEMMYSDLEIKFIINEAIEITKEFTNLDDEKQHKFTNKLLDTIAKSVRD